MTFAEDLAELMRTWNTIEASARAEFQGATDERIYQITKGAMDHALRTNESEEA